MKLRSLVLALTLLGTPGLACNDDTDSDPCGNGIIEGEEQCDGQTFNSESCVAQGYYGGSLYCNDDCTLNISDCISTGRCGDNFLQGDYEDCESGSVNGESCATLGMGEGTLVCTEQCSFDLSQCTGAASCGDGMISGLEECEGADLGDATCESLGYSGGTLLCTTECSFDLSGCTE